MIRYHRSLPAVVSTILYLSTLTSTHGQEVRSTPEPPRSIISLAAAPHPQGQLLARNKGDATFAHVPSNYHVFAASTVGEDAGVETLTLNFEAPTQLEKIKAKNQDFVVETGGSCREGSSYTRGQSCSLLVRFSPQGPGHRSGSLSISHTAEVTPMFVGLSGNGYSPVISFTPSMIGTLPPTVSGTTGLIKTATNLAVDGGDTLYIPDVGNNLIKEVDSSGTISTVSPVLRYRNPSPPIARESFIQRTLLEALITSATTIRGAHNQPGEPPMPRVAAHREPRVLLARSG